MKIATGGAQCTLRARHGKRIKSEKVKEIVIFILAGITI